MGICTVYPWHLQLLVVTAQYREALAIVCGYIKIPRGACNCLWDRQHSQWHDGDSSRWAVACVVKLQLQAQLPM